jgi:hypothetical protein
MSSRGQDDVPTASRGGLAVAWLLVFAVGGCASSSSAVASSVAACPGPNNVAVIDLGCVPSEPPVVTTTGPCAVSSGESAQYVYLQNNGAGTYHVELIVAGGARSFVDMNIISRWRLLGSDPRGCGQEFVAVNDSGSPCLPTGCLFSIPDRMCDAGVDGKQSN